MKPMESLERYEQKHENKTIALTWIHVLNKMPKEHATVIIPGGIAYHVKGVWYTLSGVNYPGNPIQWTVDYWMEFPGFSLSKQSGPPRVVPSTGVCH